MTAECSSGDLDDHGCMAAEREGAIVVEFSEFDDVLDDHRNALDPSRRWGMPAHLTVLYPFVRPLMWITPHCRGSKPSRRR